MTGKRVTNDRVCNIHHMVDGKLARMEDFRGEPKVAPKLPAIHHAVVSREVVFDKAKSCVRCALCMLMCCSLGRWQLSNGLQFHVIACPADPRQIIAANQPD